MCNNAEKDSGVIIRQVLQDCRRQSHMSWVSRSWEAGQTCLKLGSNAGVGQESHNCAEAQRGKLPAVLEHLTAGSGLASDLAPHRLLRGQLCKDRCHKAHHGGAPYAECHLLSHCHTRVATGKSPRGELLLRVSYPWHE